MKKILITGANGMLARDFVRTCQDEFGLILCDRNMLDITNEEQVRGVLTREMPDIVLNCAAYTNVDESEDTGKKSCYDINTLGVYHLARITHELGIGLITISTDYVFDGVSPDGYLENVPCHPIGNYGMSKYLGETLGKSENPDIVIVRTSWLYGGCASDKNFVNTMLTLSEKRSELRVVDDQYGSPTYTGDLARALSSVIAHIDHDQGQIVHLSGEEEGSGITWYEFAREIFTLSNKSMTLIPCTSEEYPTKAKRPRYSKLLNQSDIRLRNWKVGLAEYIQTLHL